MSYKTRWFTRRELAVIADHLRAVLKLGNDDLRAISLEDQSGEGETWRSHRGAYGANIESKLISRYGMSVQHIRRVLS